jgi:hypothetical protein
MNPWINIAQHFVANLGMEVTQTDCGAVWTSEAGKLAVEGGTVAGTLLGWDQAEMMKLVFSLAGRGSIRSFTGPVRFQIPLPKMSGGILITWSEHLGAWQLEGGQGKAYLAR